MLVADAAAQSYGKPCEEEGRLQEQPMTQAVICNTALDAFHKPCYNARHAADQAMRIFVHVVPGQGGKHPDIAMIHMESKVGRTSCNLMWYLCKQHLAVQPAA